MKTIDFSYFIERYIAGEMESTEKKWFEKELEGNDNLRREVVLRKKVDQSLVNHDLISLRNKLADLEKNRRTKVQAVSGNKSAPIKYAAVFTGLLVIGTLFIQSFRDLSSEQLFSRYYQPFEMVANARSSSALPEEVLFNTAIELFNNREFAEAASLFNEFLTKNPQRLDARFLHGMAEMEIDNYPGAIKSLSEVGSNNDNLFQDRAMWYLSLCYIATGERENAKRELTVIKDSENNKYRAKAKKILRHL